GLLIGRLQDGFTTRPGCVRLASQAQGGVCIHKACQLRGVQITLRTDPAGAPMPALREPILDLCSTVTRLRQLRAGGLSVRLGEHPTVLLARLAAAEKRVSAP